MKKLILTTIALMIVSFNMVFGQSSFAKDEIKLLPHSEEGLLRLLYARGSNSPVTINFIKGNRRILTDKVKGQETENGFIRTYDISRLKNGEYTIEVKAKDTVSYEKIQIVENTPVWINYFNDKLNNNTQIAEVNQKDNLQKLAGN